MKTKTNPTLLEIASSFELWQEYADPSGHDSEERFESRSASQNLQILQSCGFSEILTGEFYDDAGFFAATCKVEVRAASRGEKPSIVFSTEFGTEECLTEDCEISADEITGPGGWYVVILGTEGGAAKHPRATKRIAEGCTVTDECGAFFKITLPDGRVIKKKKDCRGLEILGGVK